MSRQWIVPLLLLVGNGVAAGSSVEPHELSERVHSYRLGHEAEIVDELLELLSIPNVASDATNIRRNARHLVDLLARRGIDARLLELEGSPPVVFGERASPGATRTVVFYAHYDGQPVSPELWATPPWEPVLRDGPLEQGGEVLPLADLEPPFDGEWRLYARSASDDKSPIVAALTALDALQASAVAPSVNLKFFLEGEEEAGSEHLRAMLEKHAGLLDADLWLFCDGPVHQSRRRQVVFGVRGVVGVHLTLYGAIRPLHSGHYGNWAPNPAAELAHLLAQLRDRNGEILIDGFYDDVRPLTAADEAALRSVPDVDGALRRELQLAASEASNARLVERILRPALNVRGLASAEVGASAKNAVPSRATATLGFRLVPDQQPQRVRSLFEDQLRRLGYHVVHAEPGEEIRLAHPHIVRLDWETGYPAMRTPLELDASRAVLRVVDEMAGTDPAEPVIRMPILGGSLPLYLFEEVLDTPLVVTPMVNHDNNQHAPNENLRLQNLWDGIELYAHLFARLGEVWE